MVLNIWFWAFYLAFGFNVLITFMWVINVDNMRRDFNKVIPNFPMMWRKANSYLVTFLFTGISIIKLCDLYVLYIGK